MKNLENAESLRVVETNEGNTYYIDKISDREYYLSKDEVVLQSFNARYLAEQHLFEKILVPPYYECECCGKYYDVQDNYSEIKEGGTYICNDCWDEEN